MAIQMFLNLRSQMGRLGRALAQPVTYFGLATIGIATGGLFYLVEKDRSDALKKAEANGAALVRVFEGLMARTFKNTDNSLLILRELYLRHGADFDLATWGKHAALQNELTLRFSLIDRHGIIRASSVDPNAVGVDLSDREQFRLHVNSGIDQIAISRPVKLRTENSWAIILSRPVIRPDGTFDGVISASLDPFEFERMFTSIQFGPKGIVSLAGFDGYVRARGGAGQPGLHTALFGHSLAGARALAEYREKPAGVYWSTPSLVDGIRRLIAYRVIEGFPLIGFVGQAEDEVFRTANENARFYWGLAGGIVFASLIAIGLAAKRQDRLLTATADLKQKNLQFDAAIANMPHGLSMYDGNQRLVVCNDRYLEVYRLSRDATRPGTHISEILAARAMVDGGDASHAAAYTQNRLAHIRRNEAGTIVDELPDGRSIAITHQPLPGGGWVAIHADITAERKAEAEIEYLAHYDPLTDLPNRALFQKELACRIEGLNHNGAPFALILLDLDHFKSVNDTLGHAVGDYLVASVADRLRECVGPDDIVARLGGDEFAILHYSRPNLEASTTQLAQTVLRTIGEPYFIEGHEVTVGASVGIALAPLHACEGEHLFRNADVALYRAKADGRSNYCMFEVGMELEAKIRYAAESALRRDIPCGSFELQYQPIVSATGLWLCGMEALIRWPNARSGFAGPDAFIPIAESTGLIVPLGEWVLRQACRDAAAWPDHVNVAVNLSPVQFRKGNLVASVQAALQDSGLAPERLELEITESVLLQKDDANLEILRELRRLGISIALDDFGTGYASLAYLRVFPFDKIKIDRSFVRDMSSNAECAAIVSAVSGLARSLNAITTAEGVETAEQFALVRAAGCTQAQGFLFSRPGPLGELREWFNDPGVVTPRLRSAPLWT